MAFWDAWFKPKCPDCGTLMDTQMEFEERKICPDCHKEAVEAQALAEQERIARVQAEAEARARLEGGQNWGSDPRFEQ